MTLTDFIILLIVGAFVGLILWRMLRKKDEGVCARCSYNRACSKSDCFPNVKKNDIES
ncbi:MAG: FeoB-associated Cys-rich membrane protein [Acholeplasmataceae bacterium]|jgi:hypothetical protein